VPWKEEVIENRIQKKQKSEFSDGLTRVFQETNRVLKDDGLLIFTFHHRKLEAWDALLKAVLDAGFFVTAVYPVRSEMRASTHLYDMNNIVYDVILVCRKKTHESKTVNWKSILNQIYGDYVKTIKKLAAGDENPSFLDAYMIGLGGFLVHYSNHYPEIYDDEKRIGIGEALSSIKEMLEKELREKLVK
jgi:adenine-specific DNA methylase